MSILYDHLSLQFFLLKNKHKWVVFLSTVTCDLYCVFAFVLFFCNFFNGE